jgi:SAM domain (Sterile alpha motif)/PH domain
MSPLHAEFPVQVLSPQYEKYYAIDETVQVETPVTAITETFYTLPHLGKRWQSEDPKGWTTQQVCVWMEDSGIESEFIDLFVENDISGAILLDLQFQDLRELGINSFGKRHQIWNHINALKDQVEVSSSSDTPREEKRGSQRTSRQRSNASKKSCESLEEIPSSATSGKRRRRKHRQNGYEPITPAESVSIVAIEQYIPKPHVCDRGDKCVKTRHQKRLFKRIEEEHGFPITPQNGGRIFMVGNAGNTATAKTLIENVLKVPAERSSLPVPEIRPTSEAAPSIVGPSVVASSDILGPGEMPDFTLDPEKLKQIEERDPQDNVKAFLALQNFEPHILPPTFDPEQMEGPSALLDAKAPETSQGPLTRLQGLPRLQIPQQVIPYQNSNTPGGMGHDDMFSPYSACRTALPTPVGADLYRFGTPASEADVPVTHIPTGPVARETSQSVPPNMQFRESTQRVSVSRTEYRRPFHLPPLAEDRVYQPARAKASSGSNPNSAGPSSPRSAQSDITGVKESAISSQTTISEMYDPRYASVTHSGWMKKRKTRLLRHEWNEHHFRLTDKAKLTMHKNDIAESSPLESLNIDEYTVACSSLASNKLSAKLKMLKIQSNRDSMMPPKDGAFTFQLVPSKTPAEDGKLKKMSESKKTHHFAVQTRDERIDWMRELMLAKATREREGKGYEVEVHRGEKETGGELSRPSTS